VPPPIEDTLAEIEGLRALLQSLESFDVRTQRRMLTFAQSRLVQRERAELQPPTQETGEK
jgi:hypothetical protein